MYGRVPTSKCWRWTGGTSRTCSTLQIPQPEISCKSSSNEERCCRHSITQWGPQSEQSPVNCCFRCGNNVRYWHKADITSVPNNVCFRGNSGHWSMSALPPKADIGTQPRNVRFVLKADIAPVIRGPPLSRVVCHFRLPKIGCGSVAWPRPRRPRRRRASEGYGAGSSHPKP